MALTARQRVPNPLLTNALICVLIAVAPCGLSAKQPLPAAQSISRGELPAEALATERLIRTGGPFRYPQDGATFGNRERLLPLRVRGHYREYTVASPGTRDRGARRLVCGGVQSTEPEACFYTEDHYASFKRIAK